MRVDVCLLYSAHTVSMRSADKWEKSKLHGHVLALEVLTRPFEYTVSTVRRQDPPISMFNLNRLYFVLSVDFVIIITAVQSEKCCFLFSICLMHVTFIVSSMLRAYAPCRRTQSNKMFQNTENIEMKINKCGCIRSPTRKKSVFTSPLARGTIADRSRAFLWSFSTFSICAAEQLAK